MGKRGQVTLFVLLGIVLLITVVSYYAYQSVQVKSVADLSIAERTQIPARVKPVVQEVDGCADSLTKEALNAIGSQGGFLNLQTDHIPTSPFTPIPSVLPILPLSSLRVPLWFREQGNGIPEVHIPSTVSIENDIASYVASRFGSCVDTLATEDVQIGRSPGDPQVQVTISNNQVNTVVQYPMTLTIHDTTFTLHSALGKIETQFGTMVNVALEIFHAEMEKTFLENKTIDMLIAYDPEIPFSGTSTSCSEEMWSKTQVVNRLKTVIFENTAAMQVKGTDYQPSAALDYLTFDVLAGSHQDISVNALYSPLWPTLVDITPSQGDILKGDVVSQKSNNIVARAVSSFFCIANHHFLYNIKYPVVITLHDQQGFVFQFATEVIIDRNVPRKNNVPPSEIPETSSFMCAFNDRAVRVNTMAATPDGSLLPLENVDVKFKCATASCPVGSAGIGKSSAIVQVPRCLNGVVETTKEGFAKGKAIISTNTEAPQDVTIIMNPFYKKEVQVAVVEKNTGSVRQPYSSEAITFTFQNLDDPSIREYFTYQEEGASCKSEESCGPGLACTSGRCQFARCTEDAGCESGICTGGKCSQKQTITLAPGSYHIDSFIVRSATFPFTTQKRTVQNCVDVPAAGLSGFFHTDQKCFTTEIPSVELPTVMTGGASFDQTFEIADLASNRPLRLYGLVDQVPASMEELSKIQLALGSNSQHPNFKRPAI